MKHKSLRPIYLGGAALRTDIAAATGYLAIILDAEIEYLRLAEPILKNHTDAVFGSRFLGAGDVHRVLFFGIELIMASLHSCQICLPILVSPT